METIFLEYEERLIRRRRDPQSLRVFRYAVGKYEEWLATVGKTAESIEPLEVEDFFAQLDLAYNTRKSILQQVRSAYLYAHRRGRVALDPTYDVDLGRAPEREPVVIPNDELRRMKADCRNDDDYCLFHLLAYTLMRRSEIAGLRWEMVNLKQASIHVTEEIAKNRKPRRVPLHPALGEVLVDRRYHLGQPVIKWVWWERLHKFAPERGFHDFRRTGATSLRKNGVQRELIDRIAGWAPRGVMGRYYDHVSEEEKHEAILKLYADDPI
jgi:integrase